MSERDRHLSRPAESIAVEPRTIAGLLEAMGRTGFQGRSLATALDVLVWMIEAEDNTIFLGYAGSMSTTGQSQIVRWLIEIGRASCRERV